MHQDVVKIDDSCGNYEIKQQYGQKWSFPFTIYIKKKSVQMTILCESSPFYEMWCKALLAVIVMSTNRPIFCKLDCPPFIVHRKPWTRNLIFKIKAHQATHKNNNSYADCPTEGTVGHSLKLSVRGDAMAGYLLAWVNSDPQNRDKLAIPMLSILLLLTRFHKKFSLERTLSFICTKRMSLRFWLA